MTNQTQQTARLFARPVVQENKNFEWIEGLADPAERYFLARETAWALLHRVRQQADSEILVRVMKLAETEGIDELTELWADSHARSLPGVLWRIYLLREFVSRSPELVGAIYREGLTWLTTVDSVIAGAEEPVTPATLKILTDEILRGIFAGDFADALERAAASCMIFAAGASRMADDHDAYDDEQASRLTKQGLRFDEFARDFKASAALWRTGAFE